MCKAHVVAALATVFLLGACARIDAFVGERIGGSGTRASNPAGNSDGSGGGPARRADGMTPAKAGVTTLSGQDTRLVMKVSTLLGGTGDYRRYVSPDGRYVEEDAEWRGPGESGARGGLLLSESSSGPPLYDPRDPRDIVDHWPVFRSRRPGFGRLRRSSNLLGPISWRRARVGTTDCVLFVQRFGGETPDAPTSSLSGYYCAAPGRTLDPDAAEAVLGAIGIRPGAS